MNDLTVTVQPEAFQPRGLRSVMERAINDMSIQEYNNLRLVANVLESIRTMNHATDSEKLAASILLNATRPALEKW